MLYSVDKYSNVVAVNVMHFSHEQTKIAEKRGKKVRNTYQNINRNINSTKSVTK